MPIWPACFWHLLLSQVKCSCYLLLNRLKAEEEEKIRKEAEAEAAAQIAELDRQLKVRIDKMLLTLGPFDFLTNSWLEVYTIKLKSE